MPPISIDIPKELLPASRTDTPLQKAWLAVFTVGCLVFIVGATGAFSTVPVLYSTGSLGLGILGALAYSISLWRRAPSDIGRNGLMTASATTRGAAAWITAIALTALYILLYFFPTTLQHIVHSADPVSFALRGTAADHWFLYSLLYTAAVLVMGIRMIARHKQSRYHTLRTVSLICFQLIFAFIIPTALRALNQPEFYFHYFWPLKPEYLFPDSLKHFIASDKAVLQFMGFWSMAIAFIGVPVLTYFFGKRWYCSWVCGCGALAETLGDPYRHLSNKSRTAWHIEVWSVYSVLAFIVLTTALLWIDAASDNALLGTWSHSFRSAYGFLIGSVFSGVVGVGFYPLLGSRVWCRFGCPQAAILGILQKVWSRFRITANSGQCISCGNCSAYCEMGIDVRAYAQQGEHIVRASCVGCGMCASVCPRGVLKLENTSHKNRYNKTAERTMFYNK